MIDFRYHLVSLVAVFIALAVGIALGGGPLREGISSTLESEVSDLRAERTDLRSQVDIARRQAEAKEDGLTLVAARALDGTLPDVRVGLVILPGADRNIIDSLDGYLTDAGADVALYAELGSRWDAPETSTQHQELLRELAGMLDVPQPSDGAYPSLAQVLAAVLAGQGAEGHFDGWLAAAAALDDEGIVDLTWRDGDPAGVQDRRAPQVLVMVSGGLSVAAATETSGAQTLTGRLDLVEALADTGVPLVVAGNGGEAVVADLAERLDPLVRAVREDPALTREISTVDNLESIAGQLAASFATAWELRGESGQYGLGELAQGAFPALPPSSATPGILPGGEPGEPDPEEPDQAEQGDPAGSTAP